MKNSILMFSAIVISLISCNNATNNSTASADSTTIEKKDTVAETHPPMDSAAMMKAWMDFATPGPMHTWLSKMNGTWDADVSQWMDPAAPPTIVKSTSTQTMGLGGRYAIGKFTGSMMGQPFEGMSIMGYDNSKKVFVNSWVDNMGTGIVQMSGTYDESTKTLNLKGHQTDPTTGKDCDIREEMKIIDDNNYIMTMYGPDPTGKEMKFMEGKFTKRKA
ncbi:MAG: DUF1579 domain-containing protein [Bacteroidota bacterium]